MSDRYLSIINGDNVLRPPYDDEDAADIPSDSALRQFADDYPDSTLGWEVTDAPDGLIAYGDGRYSYSGAQDTITFTLYVNSVASGQYTQSVGASGGGGGASDNQIGLLAYIGRMM